MFSSKLCFEFLLNAACYLLVGLYSRFQWSMLDLTLVISGTADLFPTSGYHRLLLTGTFPPSSEEPRLLVFKRWDIRTNRGHSTPCLLNHRPGRGGLQGVQTWWGSRRWLVVASVEAHTAPGYYYNSLNVQTSCRPTQHRVQPSNSHTLQLFS